MATPNTTFTLSPDSERALITYATAAQSLQTQQYSLRSEMENIDRTYMREKNWTDTEWKARVANRVGDAHKMQDPTVPIVMPQVEAALGYMINVFLTGYPIFGVGASPDMEDAAMQMETIIAENSITAGWARQLIMFFRDGLKYNLHGIECTWGQKTVASIETDLNYPNSAKPKETLWNGNILRRMDLYNTFFDPRVHPAEVHSEGEFAGYVEVMSRVRMKKFMNDLYNKIPPATIVKALESSLGASGIVTSGSGPFMYYFPLLNPFPLQPNNVVRSFDWLSWANATNQKDSIKYQNAYNITTLYCRILPKDFGMRVPQENTPQIWKLIIVNNSVVVVCERQTNAHNYIPIFFGQPIEDGLDYQTKSFATNVTDLQDISSAMLAGYMASKRRLVGDRVLYDPLRIREKDINSTNPSAKIPIRPSAYGKNVSEAVYQFPFRDEQTGSLLEGAQLMMKLADSVNNQNPAQQGQFVKGNKTLHEYDDIMGHGNMRNQSMAMMTEGQVLTPMKEVIKLNILQNQQDGTIYNSDRKQMVQIDITKLRTQAVQFKVSDGIMPQDKLIGSEALGQALQALMQSPPLAAAYNIGPAFTYLMKTQGADLSPFEKSPLQQQFEQQQGQWQQVAIAAVKAGKEPPPQPQMPPELVQELQQKQQTGGVNPSSSTKALSSTQGATSQPAAPPAASGAPPAPAVGTGAPK